MDPDEIVAAAPDLVVERAERVGRPIPSVSDDTQAIDALVRALRPR